MLSKIILFNLIMKYLNIFCKKFLLITFLFFSYLNYTSANINFTVSPIKYEIEASTWQIITKTAMLFNRTNETLTIFTWKSDFEAKDQSWNPKFVRKNKADETGQELSSWINIENDSFTIAPLEEKEINFTINIPDNASPWWHYAAVFFKNKNDQNNSNSQIKINVDYWVLLLVNIAWEIKKEWEVKETIIKTWWSSSYSNLIKDKCPYWDFTRSFYDGKCIDDWKEIIDIIKNNNKIPTVDEKIDNNSNNDDDFSIGFETPFKNTWNTHIKPTWTIKLIDEDWNEIKWIWKKSILNEDWAIIWEEIVDYLPINDIWWNVLPNTDRNFESEWKWFPYKDYDGTIKYWTPEEYYTNKNIEKNLVLMPWEIIKEKINDKIIKSVTEVSYIDENWEEIKFNSAKDFNVKYKELYIWLNYYFISLVIAILLIIIILWLIFKKKKTKCNKCNKKIDKDMKICPYCWKKQKD